MAVSTCEVPERRLASARLRQQTVLTLLARVCNTDVRNRLDYHGHQHLPRTDRLLLAKNGEFYATFHRHNAVRPNSAGKGRNIFGHS